MSNRNRDSSSPQNAPRSSAVHFATYWTVSIFLNLCTAFAIFSVTAYFFDYYVGKLLGQGLDAGVGVIFLLFFGSPIMFFAAIFIWVNVCTRPTSLVQAVGSWLMSLVVAVGASLLITFGLIVTTIRSTQTPETSSALYNNIQLLIVLGFPTFAFVVYGVVLNAFALRRLRQARRSNIIPDVDS